MTLKINITLDSIKSISLRTLYFIKSFMPIIMTLIPLWLVIGCIKADQPVIEDITTGGKWNLSIGDSYENIYQNLQELGKEKEFQSVAVVGRGGYEEPHDIREILPYYNWLSIQTTTGRVEGVLLSLENDRVKEILVGNSWYVDSLDLWPEDFAEDEAIRRGDTFEDLFDALEHIHSSSVYMNYQYILPDKPLDLDFDPDMKNYGQWAFTFLEDPAQPGKQGTSQVRLFFENGKLVRIHHVFDEHEVVI